MLRRNVSLWRNVRNFPITCSLAVFILLSLLCWINVSSGSKIYDGSLDNENNDGVIKRKNIELNGKISGLKRDSNLRDKVLRRNSVSQGEIDSNHVTWSKRATATESSPTCGTQCEIIITVASVILFLILTSGIFYFVRRRRLKRKVEDVSKSGKTSVSGSPENRPLILPDTIPGSMETYWNISNQETAGVNFAVAERFTVENPPQDELPPLETIPAIQELGGAKAWEWLPVDSVVTEQTISISNDGKVITFNKRTDSMIQTNYPFFIPVEEGKTVSEDLFEQPETAKHRSGQPIHYFEITVLANPDKNNVIAVGVATKPYPPFRLPGLNVHSIGFHSNGRKFYDSTGGQNYGSPWGEVGDTIGCAYNPATGSIFFTKNGLFLGNAFTGIYHVWFPTIGSTGPCTIQTNFGDNYDSFYRYENAIGYGPGGPLLKRKGGPPGGFSRRPRPSRSSSVRSARSVKSNASFGGS